MDETPNILELEGIVKEFSLMWSTLSGHRKGGIIFFIITRG